MREEYRSEGEGGLRLLCGRRHQCRANSPRSLANRRILIQRLAADTELPGERCLLLACSDTLPEFFCPLRCQRWLAALVDARLFSDGDTFALTLLQQRPLELRKCAHDRE